MVKDDKIRVRTSDVTIVTLSAFWLWCDCCKQASDPSTRIIRSYVAYDILRETDHDGRAVMGETQDTNITILRAIPALNAT